MHETIHFNVTSVTPETRWPQTLKVEVEYKVDADKSDFVTCCLEYHILDENLDKTICTKGACHGPVDQITGLCKCKLASSLSHSNFSDMQARKSGALATRAPKPCGASAFLTSMSITLDSIMCRHLITGKCWGAVEGKGCHFKHPPDDVIATIPCKLRRAAGNLHCQNGPKCKFNHTTNQHQPKSLLFGEASSSTI
jgi:hypothetical protein